MDIIRKELDFANELTYTIDEIENKEQLEQDCKNTTKVNKHMEYIKAQFRKNYDELKIEFIKNKKPDLKVEEHVVLNEFVDFLKEKA